MRICDGDVVACHGAEKFLPVTRRAVQRSTVTIPKCTVLNIVTRLPVNMTGPGLRDK